MTQSGDRRVEPRVNYDAVAVVYVGSDRYTCRLANISASGALLIPPVEKGPGTFLRLNITLPRFDGVLDVDGVVVRETEAGGHYAWGIQFVNPAASVVETLRRYIEGVRHGAQAPEEPAPAPAAPAKSLDPLETTGPLPAARVSSERGTAAAAKLGAWARARARKGTQPRMSRATPAPSTRPAESGAAAPRADTLDNYSVGTRDLRALYKEAVEGAGGTPAKGGKDDKDDKDDKDNKDKKKKKGWFGR